MVRGIALAAVVGLGCGCSLINPTAEFGDPMDAGADPVDAGEDGGILGDAGAEDASAEDAGDAAMSDATDGAMNLDASSAHDAGADCRINSDCMADDPCDLPRCSLGTCTTTRLPSCIAQLALGFTHSCIRRESGEVWCWGGNRSGQLGDGTMSNRAAPTRVIGFASTPVEIIAGDHHTCARLASGGVMCWGQNLRGQLGNGDGVDRSRPVAVMGVAGAVELCAGNAHTCARVSSGTVLCWGYNEFGQLGNGTNNDRPVPVPVSGLTDASALRCSARHTCATTPSGVVCWGLNSSGQVGDGTTTNRSLPTPVLGVSEPLELAAGGSTNCAMDSRNVSCWGNNMFGQLGDGTTAARSTPTLVPALAGAGIVEIDLGGTHSCGRTASGQVLCWGRNRFGSLGDGTGVDSLVPVTTVGLVDAVRLDAGFAHSCAVRRAGEVVCWGNNDDGQIGDATTDDALEPRMVGGL